MMMTPSVLVVVVVAAVAAAVCLSCGQCTGNADQSTVYVPGALAPGFSVNTTTSTRSRGGIGGAGGDAGDAGGRAGSFRHTLRSEGKPITPFVLAQFDLSDPFLEFMVRNNKSIHSLLTVEPKPNAQLVFAATRQGDMQLIKGRIKTELQKLPHSVQAYWQDRLFFAVEPLNQMASASAVQEVLSQWPYLRRELTVAAAGTSITVPRLDGHFQFCNIVAWSNHSPTTPTRPYPPSPAALAVVHKPCSASLPDLRGKWAFVTPQRNASCSVEDMARQVVKKANATAIIIMAAEGEPLVQIGQDAFEQQDGVWTGNDNQGFCSMIPYSQQLLHLITHQTADAAMRSSQSSQALKAAKPAERPSRPQAGAGAIPPYPSISASIARVQFTTRPASSSPFVAVDSGGRLREVGATLNPSLSILGYAAQGLDYKARLGAKLRQPNLIIPLLQDVVGEVSTQTVSIPPAAVLSPFSSLFLEARMTCRGTDDLDCDKWDHVHTVAMTCNSSDTEDTSGLHEANVSPHEVGRWITPYRRRVGHWLTPATRLLATLDDASTCTVTLHATDNGSPWVFSLSARLFEAGGDRALSGDYGERWPRQAAVPSTTPAPTQRPVLDFPLFNSSVHATFDGSYNNRTAITVSPGRAFLSASLEAIISGHGTMEFVASRHVFTVNGHAYNVSFMDPLDKNGCAKHVWQGVEPNGHGAFEFGRDGWCNGWHVPPVVFNVTSAVTPSGSSSSDRGNKITIGYRAYQYDATNSKWTEPHSPAGEMRLSSRIVFWA